MLGENYDQVQFAIVKKKDVLNDPFVRISSKMWIAGEKKIDIDFYVDVTNQSVLKNEIHLFLSVDNL